jgi:hypothetical protein
VGVPVPEVADDLDELVGLLQIQGQYSPQNIFQVVLFTALPWTFIRLPVFEHLA